MFTIHSIATKAGTENVVAWELGVSGSYELHRDADGLNRNAI